MTTPRFTLHHAPRSRSARALWLLEEAQVPYDVALHDLQQASQKDAAYLAVNPAGKVPALVDRGPDGTWSAVVTESAAICAYVADALPESHLAPAISSPLRGAYMTWLAYCPGVLEPAFADLVFARVAEPPRSALGWPPFEAVIDRLEQALQTGPWLLGDTFSAADVLIGSMLQWLDAWGKLPPREAVPRYLHALASRPALLRAQAKDAALSPPAPK